MWCPWLQMHLSCFQDYYNSLVRRHSSETGYPGLTVSLRNTYEFEMWFGAGFSQNIQEEALALVVIHTSSCCTMQ